MRLVPEEGRGHISKRAYHRFVEGVPMGRIALLAARRSTITHVAAMCNKPSFQSLLPQLVLVAAKIKWPKPDSLRFERVRPRAGSFGGIKVGGR